MKGDRTMAIIAVVGAGVMGTALTFPLRDNQHEVRLIGTHLDEAIIESCKTERVHPKLKRTIPDGIQPFFHTEIAQGMENADIVLLGVNSQGVHWAADAIAPHLKAGQIVMMVTKGLESSPDGDIMILPDVVYTRLPESIRDVVEYAAIGGPSIAGELAGRVDTSVVFVSRNADILPFLQETFETDYYHIWTSTDMIGVEVCVALKNPFALAMGLVRGLLEDRGGPDEADAVMHNYAAALFAQGLTEIAYMVELLGGTRETVYSLPGAGDLYVTAQGGRNQRMGRMLGKGMSFSDAVEEMPGETIEGVDAIVAIMPAIEAQIAAKQIDPDAIPLLRAMHRIVTRNSAVDIDFKRFFRTLPFDPPQRQR